MILLCRSCHKQIHTLFTESELASDYNSIEALAAHPEVARFVHGLFASHRPLKSPFDVVEARVVKSERRGGAVWGILIVSCVTCGLLFASGCLIV